MPRDNSEDEGQEQSASEDETPKHRRTEKSHVNLPQSSVGGANLAEGMSRLAPVLRANLVRYGLTEHDAEDVVQEVFLRALAYRPGFPALRDFVRWATVVGGNLAYDRLREMERTELGEVEQRPFPDPADEVERWSETEAVVRAYESLSELDRRVLYDAADNVRPEDAQERTRFKVWLSRARARLRRRLGGWVGAGLSRGRYWGDVDVIGTGLGGIFIAIGLATGIVGPAESSGHSDVREERPAPATAWRTEAREMGRAELILSSDRPALVLGNGSPRSARADPPRGRLTYERVEVAPAGTTLAAVDTHEPTTNEPPLVCLWNMPVLGSRCVSK